MAEIVMPRLSDSMEEGTILTWMKQVGEEVAVGDELVEIETDKANMAYESDVAGTLTQILAEKGDTLAIGAPIAVVGGDGDIPTETSPTDTPADDSSPSAGDLPQPGHPQEGITPTPAPSAGVSVGERVKASPVARRLAQDSGVDLSALKGTGPGGRIVKADVESAAVPAAPTPSVAQETTETAKGTTTYQELTRLQQVVSRRMSESKATAPHFYLQAEIDMSAAVEARSRLKKLTPEGEVVPSFNDMIVKACALALREFPLANGAYRDGRFELYSRVNV
ncbi:MAG TPA: dihydrolipoamide acetyltransferase family protein, partial [Solirubrobacterales bacterium]|nr:dihydrolipoamide acetyltransferase family protein [Solirubrobacterales bacterium]